MKMSRIEMINDINTRFVIEVTDYSKEIIYDLKPETIFVQHRGDLHLDHWAIFNAALVSVRPQNGNSVKTILAYETLSETEWGHPFQDSVFVPNFFITVSEENLQKKIAAMSAFESQLK